MKDPREFCTCTDTKCPNHPEDASNEQLLQMAKREGFNLNKYRK